MSMEQAVPISRFVKNEVYDIAKTLIDQVFEDIDQIHWDGDLKTLMVSALPFNERKRGSLVIDGFLDWKTRSIYLNPDLPYHELAVVHEVGHLVAIYGIGNGAPCCHDNPILKEWRRAISESTGYKSKRTMLKNKSAPMTICDKHVKYVLDAEELKYLDYLLRWEELWAYSYSQYMARELKIRKDRCLYMEQLSCELQTDAGRLFHPYWDEYDFRQIAVTIEKVIRYKGWLAYV